MEIVCCKRYELARKIKFTFYWAFWTLKKLNSSSFSFLVDFFKLQKIHSCVWSLAKNWIHLLNFLSLQKDELNNFWACLSLQKDELNDFWACLSLQKDELNDFWACLRLQKIQLMFFEPWEACKNLIIVFWAF